MRTTPMPIICKTDWHSTASGEIGCRCCWSFQNSLTARPGVWLWQKQAFLNLCDFVTGSNFCKARIGIHVNEMVLRRRLHVSMAVLNCLHPLRRGSCPIAPEPSQRPRGSTLLRGQMCEGHLYWLQYLQCSGQCTSFSRWGLQSRGVPPMTLLYSTCEVAMGVLVLCRRQNQVMPRRIAAIAARGWQTSQVSACSSGNWHPKRFLLQFQHQQDSLQLLRCPVELRTMFRIHQVSLRHVIVRCQGSGLI